MYSYPDSYFECYGENLITDPTVAAFENGGYKSYYSLDEDGVHLTDNSGAKIVANSDAWWDNPANDYQAYTAFTSSWYSMAAKGNTLNDSTLSHTADGSGVISIGSTMEQNYLALPEMEKKSYYLITLWVKFNKELFNTSSNNEIAFMLDWSKESTKVNYDYFSFIRPSTSGDWTRISFLAYTGDGKYSEPTLRIYNNYIGYMDDIAVYKLNPYYGRLSYEAGYLLEPDADLLGDANADKAVDIRDMGKA